ncbi:MAG: ArsR/SmtB family transcription factor [Rhabdochlamydiaceae bacterium]
MKYTSFDDFFTVLGSKQRVKILQFLNAEGEQSVSSMSNKLKIEQSAVSHDMKRLLLCHFVEVKREGKERIYTINKETSQPLFNLIQKHVETYCIEGCNHWE